MRADEPMLLLVLVREFAMVKSSSSESCEWLLRRLPVPADELVGEGEGLYLGVRCTRLWGREEEGEAGVEFVEVVVVEFEFEGW